MDDQDFDYGNVLMPLSIIFRDKTNQAVLNMEMSGDVECLHVAVSLQICGHVAPEL